MLPTVHILYYEFIRSGGFAIRLSEIKKTETFFDRLEKGIFTISERRGCPAHSAERSKDARK